MNNEGVLSPSLTVTCSVAKFLGGSLLALFSLLCAVPAQGAAGQQALRGNIPAAVAALKPMGRLAATNHLNLAIGLPLRNGDRLGQLLKEIYDPGSPNFRHYLTPAQFTEQFGPAEADYEAVIAFAEGHGLKVGTHPNRMLLDVNGAVADIEQALHVKMQVYQHPTEARTFYAPDREPSLDLATTVLDVSGLQNYSRPRSRLVTRPLISGQKALPNAGSGPSGTYMGKDFRAAYAPDTTMTGAGQTVGLLQFDGYTTSDITYYENVAGLPSVTLSNVLLDGFSGNPTGSGGEVEVSLDIEMSISMAPGLSEVIVYEAGPYGNFHDILNRMATDNLAKQLSCSWYDPEVGADPVAEQIFQQMAAQGQSFFAACGDYDAYTGPFPFPDDSPSITLVGGTALTTSGPGGSWISETVWNWGNGIGTGGGVSTHYPIPSWQTNISMTANQGSLTMRNVPDVALTADNVYVRADGKNDNEGGTSCASPLWAGFTALVNQRAVMSGRPTVGFINPALDTIGSGQNYTSCFHDITTGNNTSRGSPNKFFAVAGYDLCTGWGVPFGQSLINALATPDPLGIQPDTGFTAIGGSGGPFTVTSESFVLTNSGTNSLNWSLVNTSLWLTVSPPGGTLPGGDSNATPSVSLSAGAYSLPIGNYSAVVAFSNVTSGIAQNRQFTLQVVPSVPPTIVTPPTNQMVAVGSNANFNVAAGGTPPLSYQWQVNQTNIAGATNASLTVTNVSISDAGSYNVTVTNTLGSTNAVATLTVGYPPSITVQPQSVEVVQGSNALFSVTAAGTAPLSYQWYFYGTALPQDTNSTLALTNVQATNSGFYSVVVSSPFGSVLSSNAALTVDLFPIIVTQPQSQSAVIGTNVTFSVTATGTSPALPVINSGTLQLWLKADTGVVTNAAGQVSQWQDQSGNANHAAQANTNQQPALVSAAGLGGKPVVRFNGIQDNVNGSYLHGAGSVGVANAMTAFTVYNAFAATNTDNDLWLIGVPGVVYGASRGNDVIAGGDMRFTFWADDDTSSFVVPTNTYRIWTDRLDTNLDTLNMFDATAVSATNFTMSVSGASAPGAGYYVGGLDPSLLHVAVSRCFNGDIAEVIIYQGYLSEADRLAVQNYLEQKYYQSGSSGSLSYQWQFNGTNIANATNASLTLTNVQITNDGVYTVAISNQVGVTTSSNAVLAVGYAPSITAQPQSQEVVQGTNVLFTVGVSGTGPLSYQWYFDDVALAQDTNSTLSLTNIQATNSGSYSVVVSSPFGSVPSSNAVLTVDLLPIIVTQPQSQAVLVGTNVSFSVVASGGGSSTVLPPVASGTLQLWLKADAGVVTNATGLVSQWQDQSGNTNNAAQANTNLQPLLVSAAGLGGKAAVRFNGIQNNVNGSYMNGVGSVGVPTAMTAFTLYDAFSAANNENVLWYIGVPGIYGAVRGDMITAGDMRFTLWGYDYSAPFIVPTNTYRIRTDRLDTNLDTLNMFDATAVSATNFTMSVSGAVTPGAGYYLGGVNASLPGVETSRNFNGDIAELICYQGYLSEADRLAVTGYLEQKYYQSGSSGSLSYQWQFNGTNIANGTNASLTLTNVQITNDGVYTVAISNQIGVTISSNAVLAVGYAPSITAQPQSQEVVQGTNVSFTVTATGTSPLSYQWSFNGAALAQGTNSTLTLTNVQGSNSGSYSVVVSSPFGSVLSSNAVLTIDLMPIIVTQPQSQTALVGTNVTFSVAAAVTTPTLPVINSGTLQLWLKADAGVVTNAAGQISQWQDQSGNTNNAAQANTNLQPLLVSAAGLGGKAAVRFNGIQNNVNGSYMHGDGSVGVPTAMTAFTLYDAFSAANNENVLWYIGVPGIYGAVRGDMITAGDMRFTLWGYDYSAPFIVPTNTYRIRTDRLDTNLDTLNMFDATAVSATNFTMSVSGAVTPGAGYYLGGVNASLSGVGTSRNFNGDIAELICYQGYLSETDRLAVQNYLEQKYYQSGSSGNLSYQWQFNGTNLAGSTNASLTLTNVQITNDGVYTVTVSNQIGVITSSNAVLAVGYAPSITGQPQSVEVAQGSNAMFSVSIAGTGPLSYQWYFDGAALAQGTNSTLTLTNVQGSNSGSYSVVVSSPFGSVLSSNAVLTIDLMPIIVTQPQSQTVLVGTNVAFFVTATATSPTLPSINSGTLQLWLKADAGVVTNAAGQISQWQDQSGNTNNAAQANTNLQPTLVSAAGLGGKAAVRFNGIQNNVNGSYMNGVGSVGVPTAMTAFTLYDAFSAANNENVLWYIGVPGIYGAVRGDMITAGDMRFTLWGYDYSAPFIVPTNTYRIRTDRLDTNLDTLNMFDATAASATNFTMSVSGAVTPGAGYYLGGVNASLSGVETSRNFNGDIAELICYQGYLSEADRLAVTGYLEQKYYQSGSSGSLSYQWQFNGTNIASATNASLTLTNVQTTNDGAYTVIISNGVASTTSSNAVLTVGWPPIIVMQPASQSVELNCSATFNVSARGVEPLSYQWWNNGLALDTQTNSSLALTNVQASNFGNYNVVVTNVLGATISAVAVLAPASPPVANPDTVLRFAEGGVRVNASDLTANDTVAIYDDLTVIAVSSNSAAGGSVSLNGPWIYYAPPAGEATSDTFTYTVSDGHCGTAMGTVTVQVEADNPQPLGFAIGRMGDGSLQLTFDGIPGATYQLECSDSLSPPNWQVLTNQTADGFGVIQITDWPVTNAPARFYRAVGP